MKYDLKSGINLAAFLRAADLCEGTVLFEGSGGDRLDLKSQLCKYLFLAAEPDAEYLTSGKISCEAPDAERLSDYIVIP